MLDTTKLPLDVTENFKLQELANNYTILLSKLEQVASAKEMNGGSNETEDEFRNLISRIWVGIVITLLVLSVLVSLCALLIYHRFARWKRNYDQRIRRQNPSASLGTGSIESLPSYTIVSGLPTYDDALEQYRKIRNSSNLDGSIKLFNAFDCEKQILENVIRPETPVPTYEDTVNGTLNNRTEAPNYSDIVISMNLSDKSISPNKLTSRMDADVESSDEAHSLIRCNRFNCDSNLLTFVHTSAHDNFMSHSPLNTCIWDSNSDINDTESQQLHSSHLQSIQRVI